MEGMEITTIDLAGNPVEGVIHSGETWLGLCDCRTLLGYGTDSGLRRSIRDNADMITDRMVRNFVVPTGGGPQSKTFISRRGVMLLCCFASSKTAKARRGRIYLALSERAEASVPMPKIGAAGRYPVSTDVRLTLEALLSAATPDNPLVPFIHAFLTGAMDPVKHPLLEEATANMARIGPEISRLMAEVRRDRDRLKQEGFPPDVLQPSRLRKQLRAEQQPRLALDGGANA